MLKILDKYKKYIDIKFILENKKNITSIGIFIIIVLLLFQVVYFPKARKVRILDREYKKIKQNVDELYNFIGGKDNPKDNIVKIQQEKALLDEVFPLEKEASNIIKQLNEEARRFRINVVSITPRDLKIYKDHKGKELRVGDYFCKCMPLTLTVEGRYRLLGEFLMSLQVNKTPMITIEEVDIEKHEDTAPRITAKIELTSYILGK